MSGCSCHVETIAPLVMMSNYQNEAEIRDHVFGKEPLRPPHAARSRAQLYATGAIRGRPDMGWKAHATIGVGTGIEPAPPSEPDRRVSRIRLSSW